MAEESFCISLQQSGYKTAMMGKLLNGYLPNKHPPLPGWSDWFVAGNGYRNFDYDINSNGNLRHFGNAPEDYLTDVLSARTDSLIRAWKNHPFFIEIATFTPHGPFIPAPRHQTLFSEEKAQRTPPLNKRAHGLYPPCLPNLNP